MIRHVLSVATILALLAFSPPASAQETAQEQVPDLSIFYDALSPYGSWIYTPEFGWVWQPSGVASDWQPYTYGRWVWTEQYGWYWDSAYEWGWAPFHYGRWAYLDEYGWVWVPGTVWAPAWVDWRYSADYIGWYPLPPTYVVIYNRWYPCGCIPRFWIFIRPSDFGRDNQHHHYIPRDGIDDAIRKTSESHRYIPANGGHAYIAGPERETVQKDTGRTFTPAGVQDSVAPARSVVDSQSGGGTIPVFRPKFSVNAQVMLPPNSISKLQEPARPLAAPSQQIKGLKPQPGTVYSPGAQPVNPNAGAQQQKKQQPKQQAVPRTVSPNDFDYAPMSSETSYRTYHPAGVAPSLTNKAKAQPQGDDDDDDLNVKKQKKAAPSSTVKSSTVKPNP